MPQVFPDSVVVVQKLIQKTLCLTRSLLHIDAFHCKSHFYAGRGLVSIQKLCCSRGGRRKKAAGGRTILGHFQTPGLKSIFSASKSRGERDPRPAPSRSHRRSRRFQPTFPILFLLSSAPSRTASPPPALPGQPAPPPSKPRPRRRTRPPTAPTPPLAAAAAVTPAISPSAFSKAGKRCAPQR